MKTICSAVLMIVSLATLARAQATQPAAATSTGVYDVRDLLMTMPNYPYTDRMGMPEPQSARLMVGGGGGGGGGQSLFGGKPANSAEPRTRQQQLAEIAKVVTDSIEPASWRDAGGSVGTVRVLGDNLVVTQTKEAHEAIGTLLGQLREDRAIIRIQADWVMLRPEQLATVVPPGAKKADQMGEGGTGGWRPVDAAAFANLPADTVHYRGEISCFNGQTVSISSGRSRSVIYDAEAVVAQTSSALNPGVKQVNSGAVLEVTPMSMRGVGDMVVDIRSVVAEWDAMTKADLSYPTTQPGGPNVGPAAIDRLNMVSQELRSTMRLPLDKAVLVGGMTFEPTMKIPAGSQLYLILQVSASR